jgi:chromate transporter
MKTRHLRRTPQESAKPTIGTLLRLWAGIGLRSFGGGASTLLLIQRAFVEERGWVGADEMGRLWNLCLLTPGINLLALTVLLGRKLGGIQGIVASLAGLLLPSATLTCLLTAGFAAVQHSPALHAIVRGVIPATGGIMAVVAFNFAQPLLRRGRADGPWALGISVALMLLSTLALIVLRLPVIVVLAGVAVLGALLFTSWDASWSRRASSGQTREDKRG